jgi:O-acetyl-ADP-ribose deacetylase (regulator of RNase III)
MKYINGDLLDQRGILVHGVNCRGVMGSGIAATIKQKYPEVFAMYKRFVECDAKPEALLGQVLCCKIMPNLIIANAFTQLDYGRNPGIRYVSYDAMSSAASFIAGEAVRTKTPVFFCKIGAGLANGDWDIIETIIDREFERIYAPEPTCVLKVS